MASTDPKTIEKTVRIYDPVFYCAYFANVFMLMSISLLFRYSDFIKSIGGDEWHLGWILGIGTVGAIAFRIYQGSAIDRFGPMAIWIISMIGLIASNLMHIGIDSATGWQIYAVRLLMNLCIAGVFGSWLSFVSLRVPEKKVAEVIGVVGSSGFVGMATGPMIGDWIFGQNVPLAVAVSNMFAAAAAILGLSLVCILVAAWLTRSERQLHREEQKRKPESSRKDGPGTWQLVRNFHPGFLLIVAAIMGLSISIPGNFLRPFAEQQGIEKMMLFFLVYNAVAFVSRVSMRRAPEIMGLRNTILTGLCLMAISMVLYSLVDSTVMLVVPAIAGGLAHSFLFPSVIAGATAYFPKQNRGLATSLILAMYDIGVFVGSPLIGISVTSARGLGWPEYPVTFCLVSIVLILVAIGVYRIYARADGTGMQRRGLAVPKGLDN